jgi:hypothetical protein
MNKTMEETKGERGTVIRQVTAPEREKAVKNSGKGVDGKIGGGPRDLSHSIRDGKVARY